MSTVGSLAENRSLEPAQRRQFVTITLVALGIFVALRWLPTGTNLSHMDFRVDARGTNSIEFCDPLNPQFIPVVAVRSPVVMTVAAAQPAVAGQTAAARVSLRTASGKPLVPEDLLVTHTRRLHLLIIDPTLADYQHVHPEPGAKPGDWDFTFTPRLGGDYRVFADFTPAATGRGLYASADLPVGSAPAAAAAKPGGAVLAVERDGVRFTLAAGTPTLRAGEPLDLTFAMVRPDGGAVPLEPVMGAYAHLVAFDETRSGFAHLHPTEIDLLKKPDATRPQLNFKLTIPQAGQYTIWAQVNLGGTEVFVPFSFAVL